MYVFEITLRAEADDDQEAIGILEQAVSESRAMLAAAHVPAIVSGRVVREIGTSSPKGLKTL